MNNKFTVFCGVALVVCLAATVMADVEPHPLFTDHMVLQQGKKIPVWGWADDGEKVAVTINGKTAHTTAKDGCWMVRLGKLKVGGPYEMKILGRNTITIKNVMVGEVWVCSGQSNMQFGLGGSNNAEQEIKDADYPNIRLFSVPLKAARLPQKNVDGKWSVCTPETIPGFSAVAYFFGRDLHKSLNVPIGIIHTSWGGSAAEAWTSRETLESDPALKVMLDRSDKNAKEADQKWADYAKTFNDWREKNNELEAAGERLIGGPPALPRWGDARNSNHRSTALYNAMIAPLVPYAIQGAIWYQGESNAGRAYQYRKLFPAMIQDWREKWGQGDFTFLFVQLANFGSSTGAGHTWPELREAQNMALSLPNTGMAVTIDIGNPKDIHPRNKQDVGYRLALAARKVTYGEKKLVYSGPMYKSMKAKNGKITLSFDCIGGGLMSKDNEPLKGFEIAAEDQKFVAAEASIEGGKIVVWNNDISEPVAVRYGWYDSPVCNLFNKEGLPASPFRTDDWPCVTLNNQ